MPKNLNPETIALIQKVIDRRSKIAVASTEELRKEITERLTTGEEPIQATLPGGVTPPATIYSSPYSVPQEQMVQSRVQSLVTERSTGMYSGTDTAGVLVTAVNFVSDTALVIWLSTTMDMFVTKAEELFSVGGLDLVDTIDALDQLSIAINLQIETDLPELKGVEAKALVAAISEVLFDKYSTSAIDNDTQIWIRRSVPVLIHISNAKSKRKTKSPKTTKAVEAEPTTAKTASK